MSGIVNDFDCSEFCNTTMTFACISILIDLTMHNEKGTNKLKWNVDENGITSIKREKNGYGH